MAVTLYYGSGSPYAWRVWLALEHKQITYELKTISFDAGDLKKPELTRLNPRQRVPVIVDDNFVLYESSAILEYIEDRWTGGPRIFSADIHKRAIERRMVREADQYLAEALERLVDAVLFTPEKDQSAERITAAAAAMQKELSFWEATVSGDYLGGTLSAADFTLFPEVALALRLGKRKPDLVPADLLGPRMTAWYRRVEALPITSKTWPPHWK
jgi:glutathione S-transferase